MQPLANSYHNGTTTLPEFPLEAMVCEKCYHSQLSIVVDPDVLYKHYLYASGVSQTFKEFCEIFASWTSDMFSDANGMVPLNVLDIASNDGTQLDEYKKLGMSTFGVDPAENLAPIAREKGHTTLVDYWNVQSAKELQKNNTTFDIITAQNVFAHTDDALGFLKACKTVMGPQSLLFIQTSQSEMIVNGEFDTMYHEHLSFFTTRSMAALVKRAGLCLRAVQKFNIHGTSYVFVIGLTEGDTRSNTVDAALVQERDAGLYTRQTYIDFGRNAKKLIAQLSECLESHRLRGHVIVGYGAAAKGMTVMNFGRIRMDYIVDDSPLKRGLLTPGQNVPIVTQDFLRQDVRPKVFIPLAWNFFNEITAKIVSITEAPALCIRYFPTVYEVEVS